MNLLLLSLSHDALNSISGGNILQKCIALQEPLEAVRELSIRIILVSDLSPVTGSVFYQVPRRLPDELLLCICALGTFCPQRIR